MSEHNFEIKDKQKSNLPDSLKNGQKEACQTHVGNPGRFNKTIHVEAFSTLRRPEKVIITITDDSTAFSVSTITTDNSATSTVTAIRDYWFKTYGYPDTISFKQGKVQVSKLEKKINNWVPLEQRVTCKSRNNIFNTEVEQQWEQNQHEIPEEEFVNTVNFFYELQEPEHNQDWGNTNSGYHQITENYRETDGTSEDEDRPEYDLDDLLHFSDNRPTYQPKRKSISLCRHKLQGRTGCRSRSWRQQSRQHEQNWLPESEADQRIEIDLVNEDTDTE
jgi:hypothetical protein